MILSKGNLQVVEMTKNDRAIPALDNVHITADGATVGTNGQAVVSVSPVNDEWSNAVPLENTGASCDINGDTVSSETIKDVLRDMKRDVKFDGLLEHCNYASGNFTMTDGKRKRSVSGNLYNRRYVNYSSVFHRAKEGREFRTVAVNIRRLLSVLSTIDKICADSSQTTPVFIEFTKDNDMILRCKNQKTGQRVIGIMSSLKGVEGNIPELDEWEKKMFGIEERKRKSRKITRERA